MIEVKRTDYPEKVIQNKRLGTSMVRAAWYECSYRWNGREIATYDSKEDIIRLNTDYLGGSFRATYFERMKTSKYADAFAELVEFLNINENTALSEYMSA